MSSNTANVENGQRSQRQQPWIEEWKQGLDRLHQQEQNTRNPDHGLHLRDLDVDKLEQLNNTIQEASKLVQQALKRRKAEEAVAEGQNTFRCPIGLRLMKDPVVAADGHTYEREQIEAWFASSEFSDLPVKSPKTNLLLEHTMLISNHALRSVIQDAVDKTIASMRPRERAASPPAKVDESVGTVRTC